MNRCSASLSVGAELDRRHARLRQAGGPRAGTLTIDFLGALPPVNGSGTSGGLTRSQVEAFAGLYYHGELEATGLMTVAELLVEERFTLELRDRAAFQALETMAEKMDRGWYDAERRAQVLSAALGLGGADDFRRDLDALTVALDGFERELRFGPGGVGSATVRVEFAMRAVLDSIGRRASLGLERAATLLNDQLRTALTVVGNTSIQRLFSARNLWDMLGHLLDDGQGNLPDFTRLSGRAESGAAIVGWMAARVAEIRAGDGSLGAHLANDASILRRAQQWRMAMDPPVAASGWGQSPAGRGTTARGWA